MRFPLKSLALNFTLCFALLCRAVPALVCSCCWGVETDQGIQCAGGCPCQQHQRCCAPVPLGACLADEARALTICITYIHIAHAGASIVGQTIRGAAFRSRFHAAVVSIKRNNVAIDWSGKHIGEEVLQASYQPSSTKQYQVPLEGRRQGWVLCLVGC